MDKSFVDYHCHLLPAVDDGALDLRDALEMARILADFGFGTVHCTPHLIHGGFENHPREVKAATANLERQLRRAGIELRLVPGTEHFFDDWLIDNLAGALTAGPSRYLLVEVPFRSNGDALPSLVAGLGRHGLLPLFAHPERCSMFHPGILDEGMRGIMSLFLGKRREHEHEDSLVVSLKQSGCRFQANLGSFTGVYGSAVRQRAISLLQRGIYSCLGSDAHTPSGLVQILSSGLAVVTGEVGEERAHALLTGSDLRESLPAVAP